MSVIEAINLRCDGEFAYCICLGYGPATVVKLWHNDILFPFGNIRNVRVI